MMVEFFFENPFAIEVRGVFKRGVSHVWSVSAGTCGVFGISSFRPEFSCAKCKWLIMVENVLGGAVGECMGESWAVSLTGNEGGARGRRKDDMLGPRYYTVTSLESSWSKGRSDGLRI